MDTISFDGYLLNRWVIKSVNQSSKTVDQLTSFLLLSQVQFHFWCERSFPKPFTHSISPFRVFGPFVDLIPSHHVDEFLRRQSRHPEPSATRSSHGQCSSTNLRTSASAVTLWNTETKVLDFMANSFSFSLPTIRKSPRIASTNV